MAGVLFLLLSRGCVHIIYITHQGVPQPRRRPCRLPRKPSQGGKGSRTASGEQAVRWTHNAVVCARQSLFRRLSRVSHSLLNSRAAAAASPCTSETSVYAIQCCNTRLLQVNENPGQPLCSGILAARRGFCNSQSCFLPCHRDWPPQCLLV
jgi:hypothetical protein